MYPMIYAAGAAALSAAAFFGLKSKCHCCDSVFTLNEPCLVCGEEVCGDCGLAVGEREHLGWPVSAAGRTCLNHRPCHDAKVTQWCKAIDAEAMVTMFSKHYRGKVPKPLLGLSIATQFHADRSLAERELRILAAMQGASHVVGVDHVREKRTNGNYIHHVWKATGYI